MDDDDANWEKLPSELLVLIAHKLRCCEDYIRLSAVCKSWESVLSDLSQDDQKPLLPPESPILFLAEQCVEGAIISCDIEEEDEEGLEEADEDDTPMGDSEDFYDGMYDYLKNSVGNTRSFYRLSTGKTYMIELPEASGKLILGTNRGWLLTLGIDFQINLLHPLLGQQIPLPPMNTFPNQYKQHMLPEELFGMFIQKVAMSSKVQPKKNYDTTCCSLNPIVMTIYGECGYLGFARLGDKVWTNVEMRPCCFDDIAYYKENFYGVDCHGSVFVCHIDDNYNGATEIALCPFKQIGANCRDQRYLVESESGLWLVVRICKVKYYKPPHHLLIKYRTIDFLVWKLELKYSDDSHETPSYTCIQKNDLGDEALFIGRASCLSLPSSKYIKPNCIYFTDDTWELYYTLGGGHDMGIFNMESRTIEPFFNGRSMHPISPPLCWENF